MSKSFAAPNADIGTSAANDVEEELNLRSRPDIEESSSAGLVADGSKVVEGEKVDVAHVSETNGDEILTLENVRQAVNRSDDRPLRAQVPCDSRSKHEAAKIGSDDPKDHNPNVIASDLVASSSTGSAKIESDLSNADEGKGSIGVAGQSHSHSTDVPRYHKLEGMLESTHSNAGIGIEAAEVVMGNTGDESPPAPFSLHCHTCEDGQKTKNNAGMVTLPSINNEVPSPPLSVHLADAAITEKLSRVGAASRVKSDESAGSVVQPPSMPESKHPKLEKALPSPAVRQASATHPEVNIDYGLHSSPRVIQRYGDTPSESIDVPSQTMPNEHIQEEEGREDVIMIPEAFLVVANAPVELADVEVAELIESDRSTFQLKKRDACIASILFAAIAIALGVTVSLTRDASPPVDRAEPTIILSPSLKPTFLPPPSMQPSSIQPSSQPSLSIKDAIERNVLQRNVTFDMMDDTNARVLALDWINSKDKMMLVVSDENLFQRYILVLLALEYSNLGWLSDAKSDDNECYWLGVECDKGGHVIKLKLGDYSLDGTLPPEIGSLHYLQKLSMSGNFLSYTLPYELGNLRYMTELYLSANNFTGPLPSDIGNLKELKVLTLDTNELTGSVPLEIGNLKKLTKLSLDSNLFTGTLPSNLGDLIELTALDIGGNGFSGTLPPELGNLNKLTEFDARDNYFFGTLPSELGNLRNLTQLYLNANSFTGLLPSELGNLNMLATLNIVYNEFMGTLPSKLGNLRRLTLLHLYYNKFTGTLPSELGNLNEITDLQISVNGFTGTLPTEIGNLNKLSTVRFNENQFTGTVPTELGRLKMLEELYLFSNKFLGTIPSELGQLTSLTHFSIYKNQFVGTLPSWIGDLTKLYQLYVGGNQFTGTLPAQLGLLTELTYFGIEENKFNGTIPLWIGDLRYLKLLWLQNNQFTGTFPLEIGDFSYLVDFCLNDNKFTGSLPAERQTNWDCT